MKKAMYVVVMLIVLLLPGLGWAQERSGNETVPEYKVWLPVVVMPTCEYDVMRISYSPGYSGGNHPWPPKHEAWIGLDGYEFHDLEEPVADVLRVEVQTDWVLDRLPSQDLINLNWISSFDHF